MTDSVKTAAAKPEPVPAISSPQQGMLPLPASSAPGDPSRLMTLHRALGNQAVQRLHKDGKLQAALKIGQPNDVYEQEADRMADHIMRMPDPAVQMKPG